MTSRGLWTAVLGILMLAGQGVYAEEAPGGLLGVPPECQGEERPLQPGMVGYGEERGAMPGDSSDSFLPAEGTAPPGGAWPILRDWTPAEIRHRAQWFEHLYRMKTEGSARHRTARLVEVLTDPEMNLLLDPEFAGEPCNPQMDLATLRSVHQVLDCAKFAQAMQVYYAYRRGLPWRVGRIGIGEGSSVRFSEYNRAWGGFSCLDFANPGTFMRAAVNVFCTGNMRVEPLSPGWEHSDTVPVALDPRYILPGTLYYTDGHVNVVARVDALGGVYFLDASLARTRDIRADFGHYALAGVTGIPGPDAPRPYAGCYRGFRIPRWPVAERNAGGEVVRIRPMTDAEMRGFGYSLEQYEAMRELAKTGQIRYGGVATTAFSEYVRLKLRTAPIVDPVEIIETRAARLLRTAEAREAHVQEAWQEVLTQGPVAYPDGYADRGIFNAPGRWGNYSSAVMDVGLRGEYFDLLNVLTAVIAWYEYLPGTVSLDRLNAGHAVWSAADLVEALRIEKQRVFGNARFAYTASTGEQVELSLLDVEKRLYDLSFDPNHAPEVRWGSLPGGAHGRPTPLRTGGEASLAQALRGQAYYRTLKLCKFDATPLKREGPPAFLPLRFDERLPTVWKSAPSPPVIARGAERRPLPERRPLVRVYRVAEAHP